MSLNETIALVIDKLGCLSHKFLFMNNRLIYNLKVVNKTPRGPASEETHRKNMHRDKTTVHGGQRKIITAYNIT